ncbi:MAG: hypothetical protein FJ276_27260 [Planctomycetes bacterium]|nr:hypothetical protein [Planctomycetota bacterium]
MPGVIRTHPEDSWGYLDPSVPTIADELELTSASILANQAKQQTTQTKKTEADSVSASLPFNDRSLSMRRITIGATNVSRPRNKRHKQLSCRSLASHTAQFAALIVPVPLFFPCSG